MNTGIMQREYKLLEVDWITAQMYGKTLKKKSNNLPLSKNGIEPYEDLTGEIDSILDMLNEKMFANKQYGSWEKKSFR